MRTFVPFTTTRKYDIFTNERFFDISLGRSDNVTCKHILAARSDVFNKLIFVQPNQENLSNER